MKRFLLSTIFEFAMRRSARSRVDSFSPLSRMRGVGLPVAIFLITVVAAFVVNMGVLVQDNAVNQIEYITSLRALLAAESGADIGMNALFDPTDAPIYSGASCPVDDQTYSFSVDEGMNDCSATVSCSASTAGGETIYTITSVGTCDGLTRTMTLEAM